MTGPMTRLRTAAPKQLALRDRVLVPQLGTPVSKPLQRQSVRFAVFPLVQIALPPAFNVPAPKIPQLFPQARLQTVQRRSSSNGIRLP